MFHPEASASAVGSPFPPKCALGSKYNLSWLLAHLPYGGWVRMYGESIGKACYSLWGQVEEYCLSFGMVQKTVWKNSSSISHLSWSEGAGAGAGTSECLLNKWTSFLDIQKETFPCSANTSIIRIHSVDWCSSSSPLYPKIITNWLLSGKWVLCLLHSATLSNLHLILPKSLRSDVMLSNLGGFFWMLAK